MGFFPERLKQLRKQNNVTQKELADHLHVSQNAVYNWENRKREANIDIIKKISDFFKVTPDYLMGWEYDHEWCEPETVLQVMNLKGVSKKELSKISGISEFEIESILTTGRGNTFSISKIANALNVSPHFLDRMPSIKITQEDLEQSKRSIIELRAKNLIECLNEEGIEEATRQLELLSKIPEYRKEED